MPVDPVCGLEFDAELGIIHDHNGSIEFKTIQFGAKVEIILPIKNVS